ncbi:MAG: DUF6580 family putative transport protein [Armatimonadota bacterium]|nr:DUF6580 family putative transport protein [Armatimonadota bacterium]MDR7449252.1 DUF6580 family putative transport protein [Armatimonadota bacterium]MDR7459314.1 DUF6580 family putative transport protein [Armatimonadota bacterium]MDR7478314.1 DUF6580 family putative transport protein [Armatimonadota bacterium]MDR7491497.1 DUF6580 family putative transport protein [Armatimonadota bacterium]
MGQGRPALAPRHLAVALLIVAAAASRLLPHPPNVTPVAAMALFGGAAFVDLRLAVLVPLGAMVLSDLVLGLHATIPFVYAALAATALIGRLLRGRRRPAPLVAASLAASTLFFLVTNFGVWLVGGLYPKTAAGLVAAYVAGLPFFRNTLLGDLAFTVLLFGGFALLERTVPALRASARSPGTA